MDIKEKFGLRLRTLRKEKGLSQEELALKSGLNRPYISAIEQGKGKAECFFGGDGEVGGGFGGGDWGAY
jgi:ribosome-binding protein aMBF1 (putative translation factor)